MTNSWTEVATSGVVLTMGVVTLVEVGLSAVDSAGVLAGADVARSPPDVGACEEGAGVDWGGLSSVVVSSSEGEGAGAADVSSGGSDVGAADVGSSAEVGAASVVAELPVANCRFTPWWR